MSGNDDPASLIKQAMWENPVLLTRLASMTNHQVNVTAILFTTYQACRAHYAAYPSLVCKNPLAAVIRMMNCVVRGDPELPGSKDVPPKFAKHFTTGRTLKERARWRSAEALTHVNVSENLWPVAALLFHNVFETGRCYDADSSEWRELTKRWSSLLGVRHGEIKAWVEEIYKQIEGKGGRADVG